MELFCNLTVLADTQTLIHPTHAYIQTHTNENKQNWKNLTRVGRTSYLVSVKIDLSIYRKYWELMKIP